MRIQSEIFNSSGKSRSRNPTALSEFKPEKLFAVSAHVQ